MQHTTNYSLLKPDGTDNYNVANDNTNMDTIDATLKSISNAVTAAQNTANAAIPATQRGAANGVAPLDASSKVPIANLPVIPIANGGTGSATQNFVDLTTAQTIGGAKTFTNGIVINNNFPALILIEADGTVGIQQARIINDAGKLLFQVYNETNSAWVRDLFSIDRSNGNTSFPNGSFQTKNNILDDGNGGMHIAGDAVLLPQALVANTFSRAISFNYRDASNVDKYNYLNSISDRLAFNVGGNVSNVLYALSGGYKTQCGNVALATSNNAWVTQTVTFPSSFGVIPQVFLQVNVNGHRVITEITGKGTGSFTFGVYDMDGSLTSAGFSVDWIAIGS